MCAIDSISANFQKYNNYYLSGSPMFTMPAVSHPAIFKPALQQSVIPKSDVYYKEPETERTVANAGILQIIAMAVASLSKKFGNALMAGNEFTSVGNTKNIAANMVKKHNLDVAVEYVTPDNFKKIAKTHNLSSEMLAPIARGENAFFMEKSRKNMLSKSIAVAPNDKPSLMLHELGHAKNAKNFLLKGFQKSRMLAASIPTILLLINGLTPDKTEGKNFIEKNAGLLGFLAFVPTIIEEGIASLRGINAAKVAQKTLGKLDLKPLIKNYRNAWMTYVLAGVGLGIAAKQTFMSSKSESKQKINLSY